MAPRRGGLRFTNEPVPPADIERLGLPALFRLHGDEPRHDLRWTVDPAADTWLARLPWHPGDRDEQRFLFGWRGHVSALHLEVIVRRHPQADERRLHGPRDGARWLHEWRAAPGAERVAAPAPVAALEDDYLRDLRAALTVCMLDGRHPAGRAYETAFRF